MGMDYDANNEKNERKHRITQKKMVERVAAMKRRKDEEESRTY